MTQSYRTYKIVASYTLIASPIVAVLFFFLRCMMIEGYVTIKEIAEKWDMTPRWVQMRCASGKIPGAIKFGRDWAIPKDARKPVDGRVKTGEYKNWRNKSKNE